MKIKTLLILAIAFFATVFVACDDTLSEIGSSIQPEGDKIFIGTDTIVLRAQTVSFEDSVYARTAYGLLGEYIDPILGKIKSDYLCEFYCPEDMKFADGTIFIDSILLNTEFDHFTGDSVAPMGVSVYAVKNPLKAIFFTNIDPKKYIGDEPTLYGQHAFSIQDLPDTTINYGSTVGSIRYRKIPTKLDLKIAEDFYKEWERNPETFKDSDSFKKFFKGVYVTTTFGSGSLINTNATELVIHYRNFVRNADNSADSLVFSQFRLPTTGEVIQMNHVKNEIPEEIFTHHETKTYMKTPAGVYTSLKIPLKSIIDKGNKDYGVDHTLNAANFKIKGFTEEEEKSGLTRPSSILFINKDSLNNFFYNRKMPDNKTSFAISRSTSTNSYDFGNIATIINHYADHYKDKAEIPENLEYLIIPISTSYTTVSNQNVLSDMYNLMYPTSTVFRTDSANMRMSIIYSKYNKAYSK